jgi:hypothetical protein
MARCCNHIFAAKDVPHPHADSALGLVAICRWQQQQQQKKKQIRNKSTQATVQELQKIIQNKYNIYCLALMSSKLLLVQRLPPLELPELCGICQLSVTQQPISNGNALLMECSS